MTRAECNKFSLHMQNYGHLLHHNTVWSLYTARALISPDFSVALRCHVLLVVAGGRNKEGLPVSGIPHHPWFRLHLVEEVPTPVLRQ